MRGTRMLAAGAVAVAVSSVAPAASAHSETATCVGQTVLLGPPSNYTVTGGDHLTIQQWDFTGVQDLCLADGTVVKATMSGRLRLFTLGEGTGWIVVRYTDTIPMGTLDGIVVTHFSPTSFDARVNAFGGTGILTGMTGSGTTVRTGENTFDDRMQYRYP